LEYYTITGTSYENIFINYRKSKKYEHILEFLDFFGEFGTNFLENPYGFEYDLILHKYAPKY
jgi:hypothetical protein